jgi:hypothetical protein
MPPKFERGTKRRHRSTRSIEWEIGHQGSGRWVTIPPREFESSVPWWARWFISRDDPRFLLAALVHDYMLESGVYGRPQAAAEWYDGAMAGGAPRRKAKVAFIGLAAWAVINEPSEVNG